MNLANRVLKWSTSNNRSLLIGFWSFLIASGSVIIVLFYQHIWSLSNQYYQTPKEVLGFYFIMVGLLLGVCLYFITMCSIELFKVTFPKKPTLSQSGKLEDKV